MMKCNNPILINSKTYDQDLSQLRNFDDFMRLTGKPFRKVKARETLQLTIGKNSYFIKKHYGVGLKEILKSLLSLKRPILGARTEWLAIKKLDEIGVKTTPLVAYGDEGCNPATKKSFVLTLDLGDIVSLESFCFDWLTNPPSYELKVKLIKEVASLTATLHRNGIQHRDYYLCHLCLDNKVLTHGDISLYLIDLHRVIIHQNIPRTAMIKELSALYFSALHIGLSCRDLLRFVMTYSNALGNNKTALDKSFWEKVDHRARKLDAKFKRKIAKGTKL